MSFKKIFFSLGVLALVPVIVLAFWAISLDAQIREAFEGRRWTLPTRVYASPLELYEGAQLSVTNLEDELKNLGYESVASVSKPGRYKRIGNQIEILSRGFRFLDGEEKGRHFRVSTSGSRISSIQALDEKGPIDILRLDPAQIASIYPSGGEDRVLVKIEQSICGDRPPASAVPLQNTVDMTEEQIANLEVLQAEAPQVPETLVKALMAVEDKAYCSHPGINPLAIARAMVVNIQQGGFSQGGSTLTQQLVKNFFLTRDKTLIRKAKEAVMSLLLDRDYSKDEILEAYMNEVNLGQSGPVGINGFGLASQYYFGQPLNTLSIQQQALLVGMVKAPSSYNPRSRPEAAMKRRNLVLSVMRDDGLIDQVTYLAAIKAPLDVTRKANYNASLYPDFVALVRRQLEKEYAPEILETEGLRVFTSLNPHMQMQAQAALDKHLAALRRDGRVSEKVNGAVVVVKPGRNQVEAIVSGKGRGTGDFLRAVEAERNIGSTVKPFTLLAALQTPHWRLDSLVEDAPVSIDLVTGEVWEPKNIDKKYQGNMTLLTALKKSRNVPFVKLGMDVGPDSVAELFEQAGVPVRRPAVPASLLGAESMTPMDVTRAYLIIANQGVVTEPVTIIEVTDQEGRPMSRNKWKSRRVADAGATYLVQYAMAETMRSGTGAGLGRYWARPPITAGKSGTSNNEVDAWFAGLTENYLTLVWVGHDDNKPMRAGGTAAAMPVWAYLMDKMGEDNFSPRIPGNVVWSCVNGTPYPYLETNLPEADRIDVRCLPNSDQYRPAKPDSILNWLKQNLGGATDTGPEPSSQIESGQVQQQPQEGGYNPYASPEDQGNMSKPPQGSGYMPEGETLEQWMPYE
jgi:penicillin-binding protein 1B